jgi:hypothetical protein
MESAVTEIDDEAWERAKRYIPEIFFPGMDMGTARMMVHNSIARAIMDQKSVQKRLIPAGYPAPEKSGYEYVEAKGKVADGPEIS